MNLTLFIQVLPKAGLGWLGVFAVTMIIVDNTLGFCLEQRFAGFRGNHLVVVGQGAIQIKGDGTESLHADA